MRSLIAFLCVLLVSQSVVADVAESVAGVLFQLERDDIDLKDAVTGFFAGVFPHFDFYKWVHNPVSEAASQRLPKALGTMIGQGMTCTAKALTAVQPLAKATYEKAQAKLQDLLKSQ